VLFPKLKMVVIYVEYDLEKYPSSFEHLKSYLSKVGGERIRYIRVNNKDTGTGSRNLGDNTIYLQGSNVDREFSGWQRGIEFVRSSNVKFDVVLFVNEAFEATGASYLKNSNINWMILKSHVLGAVIGFIDTRWEKIRLNNRGVRIWINTNCFFVPHSLLTKMSTIITVDNSCMSKYLPEQFPSDGELFELTAPINNAYKNHMVEWITEEWHNKIDLNDRTWPIFRSKVKAMLNEASLSIRIRELGYIILPYSIPMFVYRKIRGAFRKAKKAVLQERRGSIKDAFLSSTNDIER